MFMVCVLERQAPMEQCLVFLAQKINNKPLTVVGSGNQTRDFTYVTDVAECILYCCEI